MEDDEPAGSSTTGALSIAAVVAASFAAVCSGLSVLAPVHSHWWMLLTGLFPSALILVAWVFAALSRGTAGWRLGLAGFLGTALPVMLTIAALTLIALTSLGEDISAKFTTISNQVNQGS